MTRASKQIRMMTRWRQQAARLLASIEIYGDGRTPTRSDSPSLGIMLATGGTEWEQWNSHALQIERGARFNVAKARAYAQRLVAMAGEQTVFEDWTRERALGPENLASGWPGKLAGEYGWRRCDACEGRGRRCEEIGQGRLMTELWRGRVNFTGSTDGGAKLLVRCDACKGRGRIRRHGRPPGIAVWRSLARVCQRLLDTLDGRCPWAPSAIDEPSDCHACSYVPDGAEVTLVDGTTIKKVRGQRIIWVDHDGTAVRSVMSGVVSGDAVAVSPCPRCRGTGDNLFGVLPPIDASPRIKALLRRMPADAAETMRRKLRLPVELTLNRFIESVASASAGEYERMRQVHITGEADGMTFAFASPPATISDVDQTED